MGELEDLIKEQDRDRRTGHQQYRESFVSISIDQIAYQDESGKIPFTDLVWDEGSLRLPSRSKTRPWTGCPIHGVGAMRYKTTGKLYCRECDVEEQRKRRRAKGIKPRFVCPHGTKFVKDMPSGARCMECARIRSANFRKRTRAKDLGRKA